MIMFSNVNAQSAIDDKESARVFVQKFYDWYTVLYTAPQKKGEIRATSIIAINQKSLSFDVLLRKALVDDDRAQSKVTDDIVGLDWDPFLTGQDIGVGYQTGNIKKAGNKFLVDIHNIERGKSKKAILASELLVVAEVAKLNRHWVFTNFLYPKRGNDNLLLILRNLRKDRDETTK